MRPFSEFEKEAIRRLTSHEALQEQGLVLVALFLETHYFGAQHGASIMYNSASGKAWVSISSNDMDHARRTFVDSITLFNLLRELRDEGMMVLLGDPAPNGALGDQYKDGTTFELQEPFKSFVSDALTRYVMVTEKLNQMVLADFRTPEEKRHRDTLVVSAIALAVSVVLGLVSICIAASGIT